MGKFEKGKYFDKKGEIIVLHNEGFSSGKIAEKLSEVGKSYHPRKVREALKSWGFGGGVNFKRVVPAKVLLFDLETAPLRAFIWSKWQNGVNDSQIISDWFVLTWSAKWLFEEEMFSEKLSGKEVLDANDERIIKKLWKMIDDADIIIAHNLMKFDRKKANTRFFKHGLNLPSPVQYIDTLLHARKQFAITSNRLDYIAQDFLGIAGKKETPKGLWERCMKGDEEALEEMRLYCDQDIRVLEDVYLALRPYIQPHPNMGLFIDTDTSCCPACGHDELEYIGDYNTYVNTYDAHRCTNCSSISRTRQSTTPIKNKRNLKVSTPR